MGRFVEGADRGQSTLLPECLDDWVDEENPVRVIDAFIDALDLGELGFDGIAAAPTGRPSYHPATLLKLYVYGYLNRVQSSRRLEREAGRNLELLWLLGRLAADHKTIADFRSQLDTADHQMPTLALALKTKHLDEKLAKLKEEMAKLDADEKRMLASPDEQVSLTDPDSRSMATSGRGSGVVG